MKFSIKELQETADLVIFTEEILNEKLHFFCSAVVESHNSSNVKSSQRRI